MIADAIEKVILLATPKPFTLHGLAYTDKALILQPPPSAPSFKVDTLAGFVDMLEAGIDGFEIVHTVIHIQNHEQVNLVTRRATEYGKRIVHLEATPTKGIEQFKFNEWTAIEKFIIGLQSLFQSTLDREYLLDLTSHIDFKDSVKVGDTGVNQEVTKSAGIAFKQTVEVKPRVSLKPFRTFRELDQPESEFIFRVAADGRLGLYEADGGAWKITAIKAIRDWLTNSLRGSAEPSSVLGVEIIAPALADLPIVS